MLRIKFCKLKTILLQKFKKKALLVILYCFVLGGSITVLLFIYFIVKIKKNWIHEQAMNERNSVTFCIRFFAALKLTQQVCRWGIVPVSNHLSHRLSCCQSLDIVFYRYLLLNMCLVYINHHSIVLLSYSIYCCFRRI